LGDVVAVCRFQEGISALFALFTTIQGLFSVFVAFAAAAVSGVDGDWVVGLYCFLFALAGAGGGLSFYGGCQVALNNVAVSIVFCLFQFADEMFAIEALASKGHINLLTFNRYINFIFTNKFPHEFILKWLN
jgi:hypothetical protein